MLDIVRAYFRENSIVESMINSYNEFMPTRDNPNSKLQQIVDNMKFIDDDKMRGVIKLDVEQMTSDNILIRIGRLRNPKTGEIEPNAPPTIRVGRPYIKEASGAINEDTTPMECRLRNLTYQAPIYLHFTVIENGIEREPERVHIGDIPVMVKSKVCNIHKDNIKSEIELDEAGYYKKLMELGEDPQDPGGYFIINGSERVLITLEDLAPNRVLVEYNERYGVKTEIAKVFSQSEGYRAVTVIERKRDGTLQLSVPAAPSSIPLMVVLKALGLFRQILKIFEIKNYILQKVLKPEKMQSSISRENLRLVRQKNIERKKSNLFLTNHCYHTWEIPTNHDRRRLFISPVWHGNFLNSILD